MSKLLISLGLIVSASALSAKSVEQAYCESYQGRTDMPVPLKVVKPDVKSEFAGSNVKLAFTIDTAGVPQGIVALNDAPAELVQALTVAVSQWKFAPLQRDGQPVSAKVVLPLVIVDEFAKSALAMR